MLSFFAGKVHNRIDVLAIGLESLAIYDGNYIAMLIYLVSGVLISALLVDALERRKAKICDANDSEALVLLKRAVLWNEDVMPTPDWVYDAKEFILNCTGLDPLRENSDKTDLQSQFLDALDRESALLDTLAKIKENAGQPETVWKLASMAITENQNEHCGSNR